jgi:hypothetical protein
MHPLVCEAIKRKRLLMFGYGDEQATRMQQVCFAAWNPPPQRRDWRGAMNTEGSRKTDSFCPPLSFPSSCF